MRNRLLVLTLAALTLALPVFALAADGRGARQRGDVIDVSQFKLRQPKPKDRPKAPAPSAAAVAAAAAEESPPVGTKKVWPIIDFQTAGPDFQEFTLRAVGAKIEIWVSDDLDFPAGDCRNDGRRNLVTDEQARYFAAQFDGNIQPKMSEAFSTPPARDGTDAFLEQIGFFEPGYYSGAGSKIVTLVANFKEANYLDISSPNYVAGYHSPDINFFVDRNVMSVDSFDWEHRTRENPAHQPSGVLCDAMPAQPFKYEGVFAHEYQHLLEFWASPGENLWLDEGLADYAISVTGYGFPARSIFEPGWDGHIQTFLGWRLLQTPANLIPQPNGGPENSLTLWDDQGGAESLADYGAAWTFMEFLAGRYGTAFMRELHNDDRKGLKSLQATLDTYLTGASATDVIRDWAAMVALDKALDEGAKLQGKPKERNYQAPALNSSVHWENPQSYSSPGAPPNGSDYVRLRDSSGRFLSASELESLEFSAPARHTPEPMEWESVLEGDDAVLAAGADLDLDRSIVRTVTVPASGDRTLTFETRYGIESGWDAGVVQVSADDSVTWTSLGNANTTTEHDPAARGSIVDLLPGFSGDAGWTLQTFDLEAYAGKSVLVRFRLLTDSAALGNGAEAGWWIDDVRVGGVLVSDGTLAGWVTDAPPIASYTVQLIGLDPDKKGKRGKQVTLERLKLKDGRTIALDRKELKRLLGKDAETVAAIVTYDEPTESIRRYAPYALKANGVPQPGG